MGNKSGLLATVSFGIEDPSAAYGFETFRQVSELKNIALFEGFKLINVKASVTASLINRYKFERVQERKRSREQAWYCSILS